MKVRVVEEKDGMFSSEYFFEARQRWNATYRNLNSITQNKFNTIEEAIAECKAFAEKNSEGKVVWEANL